MVICRKEISNMINSYDYQAQANIQCLLDDTEYTERKEAFYKIFSDFKEAGIRYGIACSMNLFLRGVVDEFHDIDLIVNISDIHKIEEIMKLNNAVLKETGGNGYCESDIYMHFQFGRVDIDIISGFRLVTFNACYEYHFNQEELDYINIEDNLIPMISMEALYILYSMMEGWQARRRYKRILIEEYLLREKLNYSNILESSLNSQLPGWIKRNIKDILSSRKK